jgi:hypothetical protein
MAIYDNTILRLEDPNFDQRAAFAALKRLEGEHKRRIHQRGRASDGTQMKTFAAKKDKAGFYSRDYARIRDRFGRGTSKKDLQFLGNLIRSYTVGQYKNRYVYGFLNDRSRLIAEGQQSQTRKDIFGASPSEIKNVTKIFADQIIKDYFK